MGPDILAYVLNLTVDETNEFLSGNQPLDSNRRAVLAQYLSILRHTRHSAADQGDSESAFLLFLSDLTTSGRHQFRLLREAAGGQRLKPASSDQVIADLSELAMEAYPLLLIRTHGRARHPAYGADNLVDRLSWQKQEIVAHLMADPKLRQFFPDSDGNSLNTILRFSASSGSSGSLQLCLLPRLMVLKAYEWSMLHGPLREQSVIESVEVVVQMMRALAVDKEVQVPRIIGFQGIDMKDPSLFSTVLGTWCSASSYLRLFNMLGVDADKSNTNQPGFALATNHRYEIKTSADDPSFEMKTGSCFSVGSLPDEHRQVALTAALAIQREQPAGVRLSWVMHFDLLSQSCNVVWHGFEGRPSVPRYELTATDEQSIIEWSRLVKEAGDTHIRIAQDRLLKALSFTISPVDAIIDCVIAWENLFGSNSFRVSSAIACLLTSKSKERRELQETVANIYSQRNKVVHGNQWNPMSEPPHEVLKKCQNITLQCLQRLYRDQSHLLGNQHRAVELILGQKADDHREENTTNGKATTTGTH